MRQALILVGGKGTRLGEDARDHPKPLLPIAGDVRFLDYLIENIARHGFEEIVLLAGHKGEQVRARYAGGRVRAAALDVLIEPAPLGTGGALALAADRLDDVFLLANGDSFLDMNYLALFEALAPEAAGALALREVRDAARYGRIECREGRITGFYEKDADWRGPALISGGVYALRKDILARIPQGPGSLEAEVFPRLAAEGRLRGRAFDGYFIDIGLPETLREARADLPARLRRPAAFFDRDGTLTRDEGYTHKVEDLVWLPGAVEAIRACNDAGALAIVVTNQAGVARGLYDEAQAQAFHAQMNRELAARGAHIDDFHLCPYHEDAAVPAYRIANHPDRKPNPGMIRRALNEWPIDGARSFLIGDRDSDVVAARAAGIAGQRVGIGALAAATAEALARSAAIAPEPPPFDALKARAARASAWLHEAALPLWWERGFDRAAGCFHETLAFDGSAPASPRRIRVQARQTYVYALAGALGWRGPWRAAAEAGARVLLERALRPDGGTIHSLGPDGAPLDLRRDLYDCAFVIFALAHAARALGERGDLIAAARSLLDWAFANWADPAGGLQEGEITPTPPRRQNPHMHLLEACLALYEASGDAHCLQRAGALARLCAQHAFAPGSGGLREYFAPDWSPAPGEEGRIAEPGHAFEWCWLLDRLRRAGGPDLTAIGARLRVFGEVYGVNADGFTVDETWIEGAVRTPTSRLWPQTERIKANAIRVELARDPRAAAAAIQAFDALMAFCAVPLPGAWRDRRSPGGAFAEAPAPASSFYHIALSLAELMRVAEGV